MLHPWQKPLFSGGLVASNIGPVDSWEITVKGKQAYSSATKTPKVPVVGGFIKAMYRRIIVEMPTKK